MRRQYVKKLITAFVFIGIALLGYFFADNVFDDTNNDMQIIAGEITTTSENIKKEPAKVKEYINVYITGAVKNPNIHIILKRGDKINYAISLAGGMLKEADVSGIDLSQAIEKNITIVVPYK